jgi:hypothetical protein
MHSAVYEIASSNLLYAVLTAVGFTMMLLFGRVGFITPAHMRTAYFYASLATTTYCHERDTHGRTAAYAGDGHKRPGSPMSDHSEDRLTIWMSKALREAIETDYINWRYESRSQWVREAAQTRMALEDALAAQDVELPEDDDERQALIERVIRLGVAAADGLGER